MGDLEKSIILLGVDGGWWVAQIQKKVSFYYGCMVDGGW